MLAVYKPVTSVMLYLLEKTLFYYIFGRSRLHTVLLNDTATLTFSSIQMFRKKTANSHGTININNKHVYSSMLIPLQTLFGHPFTRRESVHPVYRGIK